MKKKFVLKDIGKELKKSRVLFNEPMSKHTSFRIGGPADAFVIAEDMDELRRVFSAAKKSGLPLYVTGSGTNILVGDKGIRGVVVKAGKALSWVKIRGSTVEAGASVSVSKLLSTLAGRGLSGLEFMAGIPGTLGGALTGNAGSPRMAIGKMVKSVDSMDYSGRMRRIPAGRLVFSYRHSNLKDMKGIVTGAVLGGFKKASPYAVKKNISAAWSKRKKIHPMDRPSAGCIFKNPNGCSAGLLIDLAGLKGEKAGGAVISKKHANFILNCGKARSADVISLIEKMRKRVYEQFGVKLELEVHLAGEF